MSLNKVELLGRTTKDIELRKTNSGKSVVNFTIAVNRRLAKDKTDFIDCTAWDKLAETMAQYVKKGQMICVVGRIEMNEYTDKEGKKCRDTNVAIDELHFTGDKGKTSERGNSEPNMALFEKMSMQEEELPF